MSKSRKWDCAFLWRQHGALVRADEIAEWAQERRRAGGRRSDAVMNGTWEDAGSSEVSAPELAVEGAAGLEFVGGIQDFEYELHGW